MEVWSLKFSNTHEADAWLLENYGDWFKYLNDEKNIDDTSNIAYYLYTYSGSVNIPINRMLRCSKGDLEAIKKYSMKHDLEDYGVITSLKSFLEVQKTKASLKVYRGLNWWSIPNEMKKFLKSKKRTVYTDYGFTSTTLLPYCDGMKDLREKNNYNILLEINIPMGSPAIPIKFSEGHSILREYEVLIAPNQNYILKSKGINFGKYFYKVVLDLV